ncbi:nicotianamine synthase family protein [Priestia megaterium]|uniref:nicotianamine synthase family protein n=1 Tax=Priestia megaterium TaxID=1404 RepID=UPI00203C49FA|nr:nicotianamine synthase family protein [Priestia megaterium]MCM3184526.1 SAM-dependent methyltransferase [Priestia megaterium]
MEELLGFKQKILDFLEGFNYWSEKYDGTVHHFEALEKLINEYTAFVLSEQNKETWVLFQSGNMDDKLLPELQHISSRCVSIMEKYRALQLINGQVEITDYFKNIESCIEEEFENFQITPESKVLLIGSGAFPMTPLLIAKKTRAEVVGIDIDDEAIDLGQKVLSILGDGLNVRVQNSELDQLGFIKDVTHIIFSSTVKEKYDILDQLHDLTRDEVTIAMRYGNDLKSLFNYPLKKVNLAKWTLINRVLRPNQVFDIALYQKQRKGEEVGVI